ncbi:unnamed protein product [Tenebrio molitor]|nr:unnamed protein product [Tenebrio molitor]
MEYQQRGFDLQHFPSKENETSIFSFQETATEETLQDPESEETLNFSFTISRTRPRLRHMGESDFYNTFPLSPLGLSGTFYGWLVFLIFSVVRRGSGVLSPATHAHPLSSSFSGRHNTNTTTHNIHGRPIRPGIRTLLTSWWCRSSFHHPTVSP